MNKIHLRIRRDDGTYGARCQRDLGIAQHLQATLAMSPTTAKVTCRPCKLMHIADLRGAVAAKRNEVSA